MQIGVMNHPARNPLDEIEWIGRHGFEFVDFTLEPPAADADQIDTAAIQSALERNKLGVVAHTAYYLPIGSPFARIRQACQDEFRRCIRASHEIGATIMNLHYSRPPKFFTAAQTIDWHVEVLTPLCQEAVELNLTIVLEHVPNGGPDQLENFVAILERVPLLRFHLDSGHAKVERHSDCWNEYLARLGNKLAHVHLSDNNGTADQHLSLGATPYGSTDWPDHIRQLKATGYDGTITLEVFTPYKEHLLLSRDLLRKWWDEA
jgi:sugar phosphate isomerase/epimerase